MGAVHIDVAHESLMNLADYTTIPSLKKLYRNYHTFHKLALAGNTAAIVIWLDLKIALYSGALTSKQKYCLYYHLIEHETLIEIAEYYDTGTSAVAGNVAGGLKRIIKVLAKGTNYDGFGRAFPEEIRRIIQAEGPQISIRIPLP